MPYYTVTQNYTDAAGSVLNNTFVVSGTAPSGVVQSMLTHGSIQSGVNLLNITQFTGGIWPSG